ncbi:MAG: carboxyl-terminal processing protease [Verrucomicrobiales bacterium]
MGSPAAKSGLKAGPTVTRIGDLKVEAFLKRAGETASKGFSKDFFVLQVLGELLGEPSDGDRQSITVLNPQEPRKEITHAYRPIQYPGKMSVAAANMESMPIRYEEKRFTFPKGEVLYLGFNIFLPEVMRKLRESMKNRGEGVVGLIVDVRGNPGGLGVMANGLAGILTDKQFSLGQMKMRAGVFNFVAFPQRGAFLGPVVILVDGMSASTSEIFAAGMQEAGRAHVVGRRTMGAALPSFIRELPNGDRLQHAIADLKTAKGQRVEGRGVIPDEVVPLSPEKLFQGMDPDLDKAMKWLQRETASSAASPVSNKPLSP